MASPESPKSSVTDPEAGLNTYPSPPAYGTSTDEAPPPAYETTSKDAPPSYNSIFGQMQEAKQSSTGVLDFLKKLVKLILNTIAVSICMVIFLAVPLTMIIIGSIYIDDCKVEDKIPIYLIVSGSVYLLKSIIDLLQRWRHGEDLDQNGNSPPNALSRLLGCFLFVFFIAGNIWVYGNFPPDENEHDPRYCNPVVYYFAFWSITLVYIFCGLSCLCLCCAAAVGATTTAERSN